MKKHYIYLCIAIILLLSFLICVGIYFLSNSLPTNSTVVTPEKSEEKPILPDSTVHFVAAGDNLIHSNIYEQAAARSVSDDYDFDFPYENIEDIIKSSDIAFINQETIINSIYKPSSYPAFSTPIEMGDKLISLGFNVITHSNNHVLDKGAKGANSCLDYWQDKPVTVIGLYRNQQDMENIKTITKNGITFSFIGITEHTNGIPFPKNSDLKIIYTKDEETIQHLIKKAKTLSDVVVVCPHWGEENSNNINDKQIELAKKLTSWGADIILGTHPHVLQKIDTVTSENGNKSVVYYSLGNFISAQNVGNNLIGGIADFDVIKNNNTGKIRVENIKLIPVITHYTGSYNNIKIYPYSMYNDTLCNAHGVRRKTPNFSIDYIDNILKKYIGEEYLKTA